MEEAATKKESTQHNDMHIYLSLGTKNLNAEQRAEDLSSIIFLVEKRYGRIKARSCADGSKQRRRPGYKKEDVASPTVSNEGVMKKVQLKHTRNVV